MLINPNETIHLVALIEDTTDTNTYYVRVVMRDSATGKILGQVNLTRDAGNTRRFTGTLDAPSMSGPAGRYIDTVTTVYTDSGYSVVSAYSEILERYIVATRWTIALGSGGSGDPFAAGDLNRFLRKIEGDMAALLAREEEETETGTSAPGIDIESLASRLASTVSDILAEQDAGGMPADLVDQIAERIRSDLPSSEKLDTTIKRLSFLADAAFADHMAPEDEGSDPLTAIVARHTQKPALAPQASAAPAALPGDPPGVPQDPVAAIVDRRTGNPSIPSPLSLTEVFKRHLARTGPGGSLPSASARPNVPQAGVRKPSAHVVPAHIIARNKEALAKISA